MSELFSLGKREGLHSGSSSRQFNRIIVFKPKGYPSTLEVPEVISIVITAKETEESVGVKNAIAFDLTPTETKALILALQNAVKKEETAQEVNYIGKKVRATKEGEEFRKLNGLINYDSWEISEFEEKGNIELASPDKKYFIYISLDNLLGDSPHFEIIEEPDMPTPINREGMFQTLPTPDFSKHSTILDKAKDLIYGDRVNDYGKTSDNFKNICVGWEIIFKDGFTPERVGLAMAWLKICRASNDNCEKEDSLVDLSGYAGCIEKIKKNL